MTSTSFLRFAVASCAALIPAIALGTTITNGVYQLHNHPDGAERPPMYGMRLDELFNATTGHDVFSFDFNDARSDMRLSYWGNTIHIYGHAWGGRDTGSAYATDTYLGLYNIDFTYTIGVGLVPGDDDLYVNPGTQYNYGTITAPGGTVIGLRDGHYSGSQLDFRLGDENNDAGHRGFAGISGWGWLFTQTGPNGGYVNHESDDWLFTATLMPTPGSAALLGLGALASMRRRR